jgi:type II secretory pathway component PulF
MTTKQRAHLYHDLGKMIGAGLHVDRSVDLLLEQHPAASIRTWLEGLRRGLAEHLTVSESVKQHTDAVPLEVSLLAAGERGGRIESSCEHLARYYELRQKSKDKAIGALVYPIILLHLGLVLPEMPNFFLQDSAAGVVGSIVWHIGIAWLLMGGIGVVALWLLKSAATSTAADGLLHSIPLIGGARRHWVLARFCQVFQTGLLASFRMSETLQLAGDASQSANIRAAALRASRSLEAGERLTPALKQTGAFPKTFMQSVATAEESGTLDREMERWAVAEAELGARAQDRVAEWVPRIFYFLIVAYVAFRIISMVYDIYGRTYGEALKMLDSV